MVVIYLINPIFRWNLVSESNSKAFTKTLIDNFASLLMFFRKFPSSSHLLCNLNIDSAN